MSRDSLQLHATTRNEYVEILVDLVMRRAIETLAQQGIITAPVFPTRHKEFKAEDASDIFDHYFVLKYTSGVEIEFWGQTTCYKGNELGVPEANRRTRSEKRL